MAHDRVVQHISTAIVVVCLGGLALAVGTVVSPTIRGWVGLGPTPDPPPYVAGQTIDVGSELYADRPFTLLVFARSSCGACQRSIPAYTAIVSAALGQNMGARMITSEADLVPERAFAQQIGIGTDHVTFLRTDQSSVRKVPLLVLVNQQGVVQHLWPAVPTDDDRAAVLSAIGTLAGTRP